MKHEKILKRVVRGCCRAGRRKAGFSSEWLHCILQNAVNPTNQANCLGESELVVHSGECIPGPEGGTRECSGIRSGRSTNGLVQKLFDRFHADGGFFETLHG